LFTLIVSHVRLFVQVDLVRARSVLKHRALPDWDAPTREHRALGACFKLATSSWQIAIGFWPAAHGSFVSTKSPV